MGAFGSGDWADAMTRKINTGLCRTLSIRTLKKMGVFDEDSSDEVFCVRWVNEFGEDAGKVSIIPQIRIGGNGNKIFLRVDIEGFVTGQDISITTSPCHYGGVRTLLRKIRIGTKITPSLLRGPPTYKWASGPGSGPGYPYV